jgi:hypothetical protein
VARLGLMAGAPSSQAFGQVGKAQCGSRTFRNPYVDMSAVGLYANPRATSPRSRRRREKRLRGAKLVAALGLTALVGVGTYGASYRALLLISASPATGSVAPAAPVSATTTSLPAPTPSPG